MQQALNGKQKTDSSPDGVIERCCGVIMPISATSSYDEKHWANVQKLIHRAIESAGLSPLNVWVNDLTDRISERIIGNIFKLDIIIADISDQNPNVMLELGLRLASKKPTIVISSDKSTAPFDISDFHILFYPHDLNMIEMEEFLSSLRLSIVNKLESYGKGGYTPFLNQIVVDVISPSTRTLPAEEIIVSKLDSISSRISRLESITDRNLISGDMFYKNVRKDGYGPKFSVEFTDVSDDKLSDIFHSLSSAGLRFRHVSKGAGRHIVIAEAAGEASPSRLNRDIREMFAAHGIPEGSYRFDFNA